MIVLRTVLSCRPDAPCGSSESSCSSAERARLPARKERRSDSSSARTAGAGATPKCGRARNELVDEPRRQHAMPPSSHHRDASKSGSVTRPAATFSVGRAPAVPRAAASTTTRAKGACELRKQLHGAPTPRRRADAAQRSVAITDSSSDRERAWGDRRQSMRASLAPSRIARGPVVVQASTPRGPQGAPRPWEPTRAPRERSTHAARAHTLRRARRQVGLVRRREAG